MKSRILTCITAMTLFAALAIPVRLEAQEQSAQQQPSASAPSAVEQQPGTTVPRVIKFSGVVKDSTGAIPTEAVGLTFSIYELQEGGAALWTETQTVRPDERGIYAVLLGTTSPTGLPLDVFTSGKALWLGVQPQLPGVGEQSRVLLVAVPYALKAADADTLGGKPPSAYVTTESQAWSSPSAQSNGAATSASPGSLGQNSAPGKVSATKESSPSPASVGGSGTTNYIPIWTNSTTLGNSILFQKGGNVGVGTTAPAAKLDVVGNGRDILIGDAGCGVGYGGIGFAAFSVCTNYSLLGNGTHTILNRPTGGTLYFRESNGNEMVIAPGGNVGIGNTSPASKLDVVGNGRDILIGDAGCGVGYGGIGFAAFSVCTNYSLLGNGTNTYLNRPTGGTLYFREGNGNEMVIAPGGSVSITATPVGATALNAVASSTTFSSASTGVTGASDAPDGNGVIGNADAGGDAFGVEGTAQAINNSTGFAGYFKGQINVTGAIFAGIKDFKIDHPLDPANKYLFHSSVESSEMMNIYTGNINLDANGQAVVKLPSWFQAENDNFRYSLTAIGAPAPNLHVAEEISNNQFRIAGGGPGMKVSWQVTGIRQDAFAKANPLAVEQDKPAIERGYYVHPELFGQPEDKAVLWAHRPDQLKQLKERRAEAKSGK